MTHSLNVNENDAKPTYQTILRRLNAISCAHVTLREPINKNKNTTNGDNNNNRMEIVPTKRTMNRWCDGSNAVCDTPTQELYVSVQQHDYRNQQCLQQQSPSPINSTFDSVVLRSYLIHSSKRTRTQHTPVHVDILLFEIIVRITHLSPIHR